MPAAEGVGGERVNSNEGAKMDEKKMAAVKGRWADASESLSRVGTAQADHQSQTASKLMACGEDVPFLLEQLEQAAEELRVERIKREATADVFMKRLKAAESAAGQMRAALEETRLGEDKEDHLPCWCHSPSYAKARRLRGEPNDGHVEACVRNRAALATDAGKGWLSPEEAERLQQTHRITQATLSATLEEAERLRKELADMQKAMASRVALYKQVKGSLPGYVSEEAERLRKEIAEWKRRNEILVAKSRLDVTEEECARRCRKAVELVMKECGEDGVPGWTDPQGALDAIIDRVAKGKS